MSRKLEPQQPVEAAPPRTRLTVARFLFLAGALGCGTYAATLVVSREQPPDGPAPIGATAASLALMLEHVLRPTKFSLRGRRLSVLRTCFKLRRRQ